MQNQAVNFFTGHQEAGGAFWQQAAVVGGQNRQVYELLAVLQGGVGQASFDSATNLAVGVFLFAVVTGRELVVTVTATTTIQANPGHSESINTKAYCALGEAGLVDGFQTQTGVFTITVVLAFRSVGRANVGPAVTEITVEIQGTGVQVQLAVFNKAVGLGLLAGNGHLGAGSCTGESNNAQLHLLHGLLLVEQVVYCRLV